MYIYTCKRIYKETINKLLNRLFDLIPNVLYHRPTILKIHVIISQLTCKNVFKNNV